MSADNFPRRIVCLTEETTEWLYLLGESQRIVGISAYTCRPPEAKQEKPVVSAFIGGSIKKIKALRPDLVIGFSDIQADLAQQLIRENLQVLITNQRSLSEIFDVLQMIGRLVGAQQRADELIAGYREKLASLRRARRHRKIRPKVYFEEWDDPPISAIRWVSELIEIAGGEPLFAELSRGEAARERIVDFSTVAARQPDVYIGCWCGKKVDLEVVQQRPAFVDTPAVRRGLLFEMDPAIILQPGPACLTDGLTELCRIIDQACEVIANEAKPSG